jgi:hypothetical protein
MFELADSLTEKEAIIMQERIEHQDPILPNINKRRFKKVKA